MNTKPAAAAAAVLPTITGARTPGVVLGVLSKAVIIGVGTPDGPRVVSLLDRGAVGVPNGVRLTGEVPLAGVAAGSTAVVGAGTIEIGPLVVRVVRTWDSRVPQIRMDPTRAGRLTRAATQAQRGVDERAIDRLDAALASGDGLPASIDALVGLGQGLTPGGDDVIAGLLTGLHAVGRGRLARRIGDRALQNRTTALSADLLRLARAGHACLEALAVLRAVHTPAGPVTAAIDRLLSIGHTSGADLATGLAIGLGMGRDAGATCLGTARRLSRLGDAAADLPGRRRRGRDQRAQVAMATPLNPNSLRGWASRFLTGPDRTTC